MYEIKVIRHPQVSSRDDRMRVLVNTGDATPSDVMQLSAKIQASVKARFGIELATEVNFIE